MKYKLSLSTEASHEQVEAFHDIIRKYNSDQTGPSNFQRLFVLLQDEDGLVVGGLNGATHRGWLFIENLAVHEQLRHQGYGGKLLMAAEQEARNRGCHGSHLDTYSFQALPFYEKHGYTLFGTLDDFPVGYKRHFLTKRL